MSTNRRNHHEMIQELKDRKEDNKKKKILYLYIIRVCSMKIRYHVYHIFCVHVLLHIMFYVYLGKQAPSARHPGPHPWVGPCPGGHDHGRAHLHATLGHTHGLGHALGAMTTAWAICTPPWGP